VTDPILSHADLAVARLAWQHLVFADPPRRLALLRWHSPWPLRPVRIRVHRNQPFELVAGVLGPFLAGSGLEPSFDFGPYDDALSAVGEPVSAQADLEIVWLDYARYLARRSSVEVAEWLMDRVHALRCASESPILIVGSDGRSEACELLDDLVSTGIATIPGTGFADQAEVAADLGAQYFDARSEGFAGSSLSDAATLETARRLGLVHIPAALAPRLKAIVVDLDDTLYDGVLGEDGPAAVMLSGGRAAIQRRLVELADSGMLLAVLSRNEPDDVDGLFASRPDFPLQSDRVSAAAVSWRSKADGMISILEALRIGPESVLYLDDNPGELASVAAAVPGVIPLCAANADETLRGLRWHPGLAAVRDTPEDSLRAADIAAGRARSSLAAAAADASSYVRSLGVKLVFSRSPTDQLFRIHELSTKTNQFNTAFQRLSEVAVEARLADPDCSVLTVAMSDALSDSGVIGLVIMRAEPEGPLVEELAISCRALGRGVEDLIVVEAIRGALGTEPSRVRFAYSTGPRNGPARDWLARFTETQPEPPQVAIPWPRLDEARRAIAGLVQVSWRLPQ
jgi:FkbH-like protein